MIALTTTSIGWLIVIVIALGWILYAALNIRAARDEYGSERELAANRKPYYDDETLEGPRLDRVLGLGVVTLAITTIALPVYWILEPSRMAGAQQTQDEIFVEWGRRLFTPTGEYLESFNCAGCHGGMSGPGGVATYNLTDPVTGETREVAWIAPALDTILYRFSEDEVRYIIEYGRPFSPMSPWGARGGGPMNDQQIDTLIAYIKSIQIPREDCGPGEDDAQICPSGHLPTETQQEIQAAAEKAVADGEAATLGEALFNMPSSNGAYGCARCHTPGWSYGEPGVSGQGAMGPNLTGAAVNEHFPNDEDLVTFITTGSVNGAKFGAAGQGSGRMPGFGATLTDEQIRAIVEYVRSL